MKRKYKNNNYTVDITDVNNLGYGICRVDGIVIFVQGAVTLDRAEIKIIKEAKDYMVARIEKLIEPSPYRTQSDCPVSKRCGGCIYRHITYEYEASLKRSYVENAFRKAGVSATIAPLTSNGGITGYRNKVQYPVSESGTIGYYANHSHDIIACNKCLLESPLIVPISAKLRGMPELLTGVKHIYIRAAEGTGEVMLCFVTKGREFANKEKLVSVMTEEFTNIRTVVQNINPSDGNVILGRECITLYGDGYIEDVLCGLRFRISPLSFYQVNRSMTELLYAKVKELAAPKQGEKIVDLFCGVGTIGTAVAAETGCDLLGVEVIPDAVENAKVNAKLNGMENAHFVCGDANDAVPENADVIIIDPPRKGCGEKLIDTLSALTPKRIVYVSCNPDTLARDLARFEKHGYKADVAYPFDLFPRTGHVESLVLISKLQ